MDGEAAPPPVTTIRERAVYQNEFVAVHDDLVAFPGGARGTYLRIVESGGRPGVAVLPLAAGQAGLVRTFRYPLKRWEWGIPRGFAQSDDPRESALAELVEELGGEPAELALIGRMTPNSGLLASVVHLFVARYPAPVSAPRDRREIAEAGWRPVPTLLTQIAQGEITDGFTLATIAVAACRGLL